MAGHDGLVSVCLERIAEAEGALASLRTTLADLSAVGNSRPLHPTALPTICKMQSGTHRCSQNDLQTDSAVKLEKLPKKDMTLQPPEDLSLVASQSVQIASHRDTTSREDLPKLLGKDSRTGVPGQLDDVKALLSDQAVINPRRISVSPAKSPRHQGRQVSHGRFSHVPVQEDSEIEYVTSDVILVAGCCGFLKVPILHPESTFHLAWIVAGFLFIVYESFSLPYYIAFDEQPKNFFFAVDIVLKVYFLLDIILSFFTGHMDATGRVLITNLKAIAFKYARSALLIDVLAIIPWDWLTAPNQGQALKGLRAFKFLRLLRIIKLNSLCGDLWTLIDSHVLLMKCCHIMRLFGLVFALVHLLACLWYAVGANSDLDNSWVQSYLIDNGYVEKREHYIISFYFSLMTMTTVGFGDITPQNIGEIYTAVLLLLFSCIVFAGMTSTLTDIIGSFRSQEMMQKAQSDMLSRYMYWRAVPRKLKTRIQQHMFFLWDVNRGCDALEGEIQEHLPQVLREELCHHIYGAMLYSAPFLSWMKDYPACVRCLSSMVSSRFFPEEDYIFRIGQRNLHIHLLVSGLVALTCNERLTDSRTVHQQARAAWHPPRHRMTMITDLMSFGRSRANRESNIADKILPVLQSWHRDTDMGLSPSPPQQNPCNVLEDASNQLQARDAAAQRAARVVQGYWRRWHNQQVTQRMEPRSLGSWWRNEAPQRIPSEMPTMLVRPPTYLGESCLWAPCEQWTPEAAPVYRYAAKCRSRVEAIQIPLSAVSTTLQNFSPWLMDRFDFFRSAVSKGMHGHLSQDQAESELGLRSGNL